MRGWLFFLLLSAMGMGCGGTRQPAYVVTRSGEPDAVRVQGEDARLEVARAEARSTLPQFMAALRSPSNTQKRFSIKAEFVEGIVHEHMWLSNVKPEGGYFVGTLSNRPIQLNKLRVGKQVRVKAFTLTDWMYTENGALVGGYTIRTLAESLTPEGREHMEKEGGFRL